MRVILLGPPGAGKGTQAAFIAENFNIQSLSTGDLLRSAVNEASILGNKIKDIMKAGELVSDDIILTLVSDALSKPKYKNGCLFDGFPRTIVQAEGMLDKNIEIDYVVQLVVPDDIIIERLSGRRIHPASNRIYHVVSNPPAVENVDDITGEPLVMRDDDKPEVIKSRLQIYHSVTEPLVKFYQNIIAKQKNNKMKFIKVDGTLDVGIVSADIFSAII